VWWHLQTNPVSPFTSHSIKIGQQLQKISALTNHFLISQTLSNKQKRSKISRILNSHTDLRRTIKEDGPIHAKWRTRKGSIMNQTLNDLVKTHIMNGAEGRFSDNRSDAIDVFVRIQRTHWIAVEGDTVITRRKSGSLTEVFTGATLEESICLAALSTKGIR
jgi:hypothetical protein